MESLPKVKGLNPQQQARLDTELEARKLTTLKAMRSRPGEVVAALQAALEVDAQSVLVAYGDLEAQQKQAALDRVSIEAVNVASQDVAVPVEIKRGRRALRPVDKDEE